MTNFNIENHKDDLLFCPISGSEEIGMNLNIYFYRGKFLIVDIGIGFADDRHTGVDILIPSIDFILKNRANLLGIILTHAHEDHIGAMPYLWKELGCDIYTTNFTANVLRAKFNDNSIIDYEHKVHTKKENERFKIGDFDIQMVGITHSIPEMQGLMIRTQNGNVFHTGDWKLDHDPVVGEATNEKCIKDLGDEGVLAVVGDSTNAFKKESSGSEGDLQKSLHGLITPHKKGLVIVATFASNVARLHSIASAAKSSGRKVVLAGRSLNRIYNAAKESGYLSDLPEFLSPYEMKKYNRDELLVIATGCQGEPLAAMNKLASHSHRDFKLLKSDLVIFSSKMIPGNEKKIACILNKLCVMGIEVMTERDHFVHVSGHPSMSEMQHLYSLLKPSIVIPVHGESVHLHQHAKFAKKDCKIKHAIEPRNGSVIKLQDATPPEVIGHIDFDCCAIDGNFVIPIGDPVLSVRKRIAHSGAVTISIFAPKNLSKQNLKISIHAPGLLNSHEDTEYFDTMREIVTKIMLGRKNAKPEIRSQIKKMIKREIAKEPFIDIAIVDC